MDWRVLGSRQRTALYWGRQCLLCSGRLKKTVTHSSTLYFFFHNKNKLFLLGSVVLQTQKWLLPCASSESYMEITAGPIGSCSKDHQLIYQQWFNYADSGAFGGKHIFSILCYCQVICLFNGEFGDQMNYKPYSPHHDLFRVSPHSVICFCEMQT